MGTGFDRQTRKTLGIFLVLGCIAGVFYSSYRIEMGFTTIGLDFIEFVKRTAEQWRFSSDWNLEWLEPVLQKMIHMVAFILLGFFVGAAYAWWGIEDRKRMWFVVVTAAIVAVADEGFQSLMLQVDFNGLDLMMDLAGAFVGVEILHLKETTNRE